MYKAYYIEDNLYTFQKWKLNFLTESLIDNLWQDWCNFCRNIVILSCNGAYSKNNNYIPPRNSDNSTERIAYEAKCAALNNRLRPNRVIQNLRSEPTWGDQDKIIQIIQTLQPYNYQTLLSAFGLPVYGIKHLQHVRNACCHKNKETMRQISQFFIYYYIVDVSTPSDLVWHVNTYSQTYGIYHWIDNMWTIANIATSF